MRVIVLILLVCFSAAAQAEIHRWVDEDGVVHYSETPPAGADSQEVAPAAAPSDRSGAERYKAYIEQREKQQTEREAAEQEARKEEQDQAAKARQCQELAARIQYMQDNPRLLLQQEDGGTVRLTEEERQSRIAERRTLYQEHCTDEE